MNERRNNSQTRVAEGTEKKGFFATLKEKLRGKKDPQKERQRIVEELKVAEKKFLKHRIDKPTFELIYKEKNEELIKLEAQIDAVNQKSLSPTDVRRMSGLSMDKSRVLTGLLEQKHRKISELDLAEKSYYKRKIDENTFKQISSDIQKEVVSIEGQMNAIQKAEEIEKIKAELKRGASEINKQKQVSDDRNLKELEEDIIAQLEHEEKVEKLEKNPQRGRH